jgi:hypothetical protein
MPCARLLCAEHRHNVLFFHSWRCARNPQTSLRTGRRQAQFPARGTTARRDGSMLWSLRGKVWRECAAQRHHGSRQQCQQLHV